MNLQYKTTTYNRIVPVVMVIKLQAYQNGIEKEQLREYALSWKHTLSFAYPLIDSTVYNVTTFYPHSVKITMTKSPFSAYFVFKNNISP